MHSYSALLHELTSTDESIYPLLTRLLLQSCSRLPPETFTHAALPLLTLFDLTCYYAAKVEQLHKDDLRPRSLTDAAIRLAHIISNESRQNVAKKLYVSIYRSLHRSILSV